MESLLESSRHSLLSREILAVMDMRPYFGECNSI